MTPSSALATYPVPEHPNLTKPNDRIITLPQQAPKRTLLHKLQSFVTGRGHRSSRQLIISHPLGIGAPLFSDGAERADSETKQVPVSASVSVSPSTIWARDDDAMLTRFGGIDSRFRPSATAPSRTRASRASRPHPHPYTYAHTRDADDQTAFETWAERCGDDPFISQAETEWVRDTLFELV